MQNLFTGEYAHTIDDKNRISVPSSFRKLITGEFVIVRNENFGPYLAIYQSLDLLMASTGIDYYQPGGLMYPRTTELDSAGRVTLQTAEAEHLCNESKPSLTMLGALNHVEIWEPTMLAEVRVRLQEIQQLKAKIKLYVEFGREIKDLLLEIDNLSKPLIRKRTGEEPC